MANREAPDLFKQWISERMTTRTHQSSKTRKTPSQTSMHAFKRPTPCRGIACKVEFLPIRKTQVFCSARCRVKYFAIARSFGVTLLEKSKCDSRLKVIVDDLLEILKTSGQTEGETG